MHRLRRELYHLARRTGPKRNGTWHLATPAASGTKRVNPPIAASTKQTALVIEESLQASLQEESYYRDSPARQKIVIPLHKKLSNDFSRWLKNAHRANTVQERQWIDVRFKLHGHDVIAELKVCDYVGTRKSIREALGQLLEYNHYPSRTPAELWLIVIDEAPSIEDEQFIDALRAHRKLPISLGWRANGGFAFHPGWPPSPA